MSIRHPDQLELAELIDLLAKAPQDNYIEFDFCRFVPTRAASYRGYYDDLAIGWAEGRKASDCPRVKDLLAILRDAHGREFTGYKGGEYKMYYDTPVWVANYGDSSACGVTGVVSDEGVTVLTTARID